MANPAKKPVRGPTVTPTSAYADPAWLRWRVSRTKLYPTSKTPTSPMTNTRGTALPTVDTSP